MKRLVNAVLVISMLILLGLGFRELYMFLTAEAENDSLIEVAVKVPEDDQGLDPNDPFNRYIDFESLQKINKDIAGWIYIPDTMVDYPIMVGDTDEKYLSRNFEGNYSVIGSIFAFADVSLTSDNHICLFGHNMISGQMFGQLKKYGNQEYADGHMKMYVYTPDRTKECTLISAFGCKNTDEVFELDKTGETTDMSKLVSSLKERNVLSLKSPEADGQVFTLTTCDGYTGTPNRFTTHFQVSKEKYVLK